MSWTFITNHGAVLLLISEYGEITAREMAQRLGITERSVMRMIKDLEDADYIIKEKVGRHNRYTVNSHRTLRREDSRQLSIGQLLAILADDH